MNEERRRRAAEQEERARRTLDAIRAGGDVSQEAKKLADDYTDRQTGRFSQWLRGLFGRR